MPFFGATTMNEKYIVKCLFHDCSVTVSFIGPFGLSYEETIERANGKLEIEEQKEVIKFVVIQGGSWIAE